MAFVPRSDEIASFFGPDADRAWLKAFCDIGPTLARFYDMTRLDWVHFMGQVAWECNWLRLVPMRENMNYTSASRIKQVFSYRLTLALKKDAELLAKYQTVTKLATACVRNPIFLADIVYGGREGTPWMQGSKYIGRGPTQITHLNNYARIADEIARQPGGRKLDLVSKPELLEEPEWGVRSAFADWHIKGLSKWARMDDVESVSALLNTGSPHKKSITNHMNERKRSTAKAKLRWPASSKEPSPPARGSEDIFPGHRGPDVVALQDRLAALGYHVGSHDGVFGPLTERAVILFKVEHGLPADAIVTADVLETMRISAPKEIPRHDMTKRELNQRGSRIIRIAGRIKAFAKWVFGSVIGYSLDQATGLGAVDAALTKVEQGQSLMERAIGALPFFVSGKGIALVILAITASLLIYWASGIEDARLEDAKSGAHLGR